MGDWVSTEKATVVYKEDRNQIDIVKKQQKDRFVTIHRYDEFINNSKLKEESKELT